MQSQTKIKELGFNTVETRVGRTGRRGDGEVVFQVEDTAILVLN